MKLEVENYQWIYVILFESKNSSTFKEENKASTELQRQNIPS